MVVMVITIMPTSEQQAVDLPPAELDVDCGKITACCFTCGSQILSLICASSMHAGPQQDTALQLMHDKSLTATTTQAVFEGAHLPLLPVLKSS